MPTMRSQYTISQFYERLRKKAHEIAVDMITNLNRKGTIRIGSNGAVDIKDGDVEIKFYASHMSYYDQGEPVTKPSEYWRECPKCGNDFTSDSLCSRCGEETQPQQRNSYPNGFSIDIEEKTYMSSNHSTKISYTEGQKEQAEQFIAELMEGVEIQPRFRLAQLQQ